MANKIKQIMSRYNSLPVQVRAAFWFLVCSFMQKGITSITTPIFTRILTTEEYGQFNVFNSWLGIVTIFVSLNLYSGVYMRGLVKFDQQRAQFSSSMHGLTMLLFAVWLVIYLVFRDFWNQLFHLTTVQMLAMLIMIWMTAVFGLWSTAQRVDYLYKKLVVVTILVSVAKPVVGIIFVLHAEDKVTARILGLAVVELVGYSALMMKQILKGKKLFVWSFWKYALAFNIPLIPHYLSMTVLNSADRIMISDMVSEGEEAAGIYSLAYSISQLMTLFTTALNQTLEPWRYSKQKAGKQEDIAGLAYPTLILIAGLNILLIAFAPEIITIFAPKSYHEAIWVMPPISMSVFFMFMYGFFASFEFYYEKTRYIAVATVAGAVLNIVLNFIFIDRFGYFAAGYTTLVCYMVYSVCHYCGMLRVCKKELDGKKIYSLKKLFAISASFMTLGFIFLFTYINIYLRYALIAVCFVVIFISRKWILNLIMELKAIRSQKKKT